MKRCFGTIVTVVTLFCISAVISRAQTDTVSDADSKGIDQTIAGYIDSFNRYDAHALSMMFTEDGDFMNPTGATDHTRPAVEQHFTTLFNGALKGTHRVYEVKSIRLLSPQVALVFAISEMSGRKTADGADAPNAKYSYEIIAAKQKGQWLISNLHETLLP